MKLTRKEVKAYRQGLSRKQKHMCALCGTHMLEKDRTLDHDHVSGHVRKVLHRSCNAAEGKILSWCKRTKSDNPVELLKSLLMYWMTDWSGSAVHPAHLTHEEQLIKKYRSLRRSSKRERTKQKYTDLIEQVIRGMG